MSVAGDISIMIIILRLIQIAIIITSIIFGSRPASACLCFCCIIASFHWPLDQSQKSVNRLLFCSVCVLLSDQHVQAIHIYCSVVKCHVNIVKPKISYWRSSDLNLGQHVHFICTFWTQSMLQNLLWPLYFLVLKLTSQQLMCQDGGD